MDTNSFQSRRLHAKPVKSQTLIANWAESLATFTSNYHKVLACLHHQPSVGECPSKYSQETFVALLMKMQTEVQLLNQDIDNFDPFTAEPNQCFHKKLATHTRYLTRLNQRAFLLLVDQSPN